MKNKGKDFYIKIVLMMLVLCGLFVSPFFPDYYWAITLICLGPAALYIFLFKKNHKN